MALHSINISNSPPNNPKAFALFYLGFRPFFLGAGLFAVFSMLAWMLIYAGQVSLPLSGIPMTYWHAHEMIYGYGLAVIAGFLLTATKNWTGQQTLHGWGLTALFSLWVIARLMPLFNMPILWIAIVDLSFCLFLIVSIAWPIIKVRQWQQLILLVNISLLTIGNALFYAGLLGYVSQGGQWGLYFGLYLVIGLIMIMGRRVIPFFIERGAGYPVKLKNWLWLDISSVAVFVIFFILATFTQHTEYVAMVALLVFALHSLRLWGWYTAGIWKKSLLWSLYVSYATIVLGFLLYSLSYYFSWFPLLAIHLFAIGGIGLMTLSMMARVALGHTGRNVQQPPMILHYLFLILCASVISRVVMPLLMWDLYFYWVLGSQILWIIAFSGFVYVYTPILIRPRVDNVIG
ncbi:NnrS family protein [Candidatus Albibeggiatoa sp. nov. NOAA]|uniref:NnrS family protein n=1 Tax=Candidatus Albibeggiatoa sp. nov. NOAA TaxID=3162724 RepID=UPI0032FF2998|nr:NnrS family protein [Thiotrichaceae bacterium]